MIIVMKTTAKARDLQSVLDTLAELHLTPHVSRGVERTVIGVLGPIGPTGVPGVLPGIPPDLGERLEGLPGVETTLRVSKPYKLASREFHPEPTLVRVPSPAGEITLGGDEVIMMAGPCTVEREEQLMASAHAARA